MAFWSERAFEPALDPAPAVRGFGRPFDIAFTFDDGPHPLHTRRLLRHLEEHGVQAAFFVNGCWIHTGYPRHEETRSILREIHERGHLIGNHTFSHRALTRLTAEEQQEEIASTAELVAALTNHRPTLFRAPYAAIGSTLRDELPRLGYVEILWNAAAPDEESRRDQHAIRDEVMRWLRVHRGGIVMLHDRWRESVDAVPLILDEIERESCRRLARGQAPFRVVPFEAFLRPPATSPSLARQEDDERRADLLQQQRRCANGTGRLAARGWAEDEWRRDLVRLDSPP